MALFGPNGWLFSSKGAMYLEAPVPDVPPFVVYPGEPGPLPASNSACVCCCSCPAGGSGGGGGSYKTTKTLTVMNVPDVTATCWVGLLSNFSYRFNSLTINGTFTLTLRAQYLGESFFNTGGLVTYCYYGVDVPASADQWPQFSDTTCSGPPSAHFSILHFDLLVADQVMLYAYLTDPSVNMIGPYNNEIPTGQGPIICGGYPNGLDAPGIDYLDLGGPLPCGGSLVFDSANPPPDPRGNGELLQPNAAGYGDFIAPAGGLFGGKFVLTDA
ncbi:MAG TPA: hypothetical protein VK797_07340 [Tepidisphaeraceae bacterium]|jgi:hypothetical protein|nr:hypothetical protein [Tepidisphaeraceae bacterium]